jgi:hypothetical protein
MIETLTPKCCWPPLFIWRSRSGVATMGRLRLLGAEYDGSYSFFLLKSLFVNSKNSPFNIIDFDSFSVFHFFRNGGRKISRQHDIVDIKGSKCCNCNI